MNEIEKSKQLIFLCGSLWFSVALCVTRKIFTKVAN
jgi:hypothetical protein